jgi:hypothetical protein
MYLEIVNELIARCATRLKELRNSPIGLNWCIARSGEKTSKNQKKNKKKMQKQKQKRVKASNDNDGHVTKNTSKRESKKKKQTKAARNVDISVDGRHQNDGAVESVML